MQVALRWVCGMEGCTAIGREKGGTAPAGGSSTAGLVVDSIVFLWLAFGSLEFLPGQIVSKAWMVLLSIPFVAWLRRRDHRLGLAPA